MIKVMATFIVAGAEIQKGTGTTSFVIYIILIVAFMLHLIF